MTILTVRYQIYMQLLVIIKHTKLVSDSVVAIMLSYVRCKNDLDFFLGVCMYKWIRFWNVDIT